MVWNGTKDWGSETLTSADMDTYLSDNTAALKDPPAGYATLNEGSNYTTTSTSFVDTDATEGKLKHTITVVGSRVLVGFWGIFTGSINLTARFNVAIDGTRQAPDDGYIAQRFDFSSGNTTSVCFVIPITGITPGSRIFTLQWRTDVGTLTLFAGATAGDSNSGFWVQEM